ELLERLSKMEIEIGPLYPAEMGRAENVWHGQEGMVSVGHRLVLVNVDGGVAGPALAQRREQGAPRDQLGARGVHESHRERRFSSRRLVVPQFEFEQSS